jgi:glycosyltransferase involved in cell wall biosynthesis
LAPPSVRAAHAAEQGALDCCARAVYSSQWAADTARRAYAIDSAKIAVVPFGGNLQEPPSLAEAAAMVESRSRERCELLFVGVDWERKGADVAVEAAKALKNAGFNTRLTIVGCRPPRQARLPDFVEVIPFIGKETAEGRSRLRQIFSRSHFFVMPSHAEAFGIVFAEACAFGVPCLATKVGGLPSVIVDDVNGRLFPSDAEGSAYAEHIAALMTHPSRYRELALRAALEAATRLSWKVSGRKIAEMFEAMVASRPAGPAPGSSRKSAEPAPLTS